MTECHGDTLKVEMESSGWHQDVLEERAARIARGEAKFVSLTELMAGRYTCAV